MGFINERDIHRESYNKHPTIFNGIAIIIFIWAILQLDVSSNKHINLTDLSMIPGNFKEQSTTYSWCPKTHNSYSLIFQHFIC